MTPKQFNELHRQADVIEAHTKNEQVDKAVDLFIETLVLPFVNIDQQSHKWHDLYSKECELFAIMSKFEKSQSVEYKKRITKEAFKWKIKQVTGFFMLGENHNFNDEGHGYLDTRIEYGGMQIDILVYRKVEREIEFYVDMYGHNNTSRESRLKKLLDLEKQFHNYISNQL
tara:strand:+ start:24 stop:536 length:513 start_codon:yes stop_codon:yes gene_type:complete